MPQNPYVIYGKIKKDGVLQNTVAVTIRNVTKSQECTIYTNNVGEYAIDLGDTTKYSSGYSNGDSVKVTTLTAERTTTVNTSLFGEQLDINIKTFSIDSVIKKTFLKEPAFDSVFKKLGITQCVDLTVVEKAIYQKQRNFDILNKKLGALKQRTIDGDFKKRLEKTLGIDAWLLKRLSKQTLIDVALKKLGVQKQRNFDIVNKKLAILKQKTIDSDFKKLSQETVNTDAVFKKGYSVSKTVDSVFKSSSKERLRNIDAITKAQSVQQCSDISSLIRKLAILEQYGIDVVQLKKEILKTFGLDVILGAITVVHLDRQLDAIFKKYDVLNSKNVDAILLKNYQKTMGIDGRFRKTFSKSRTINAFIKKRGITKTVGVNAYIGKALVRYVALDSFLKKTVEVQRGFNVLLKKLAILKQLGADSFFEKTNLKQPNVDSVFKKTPEFQRNFDSLLKRSVIQKQFGIDVKIIQQLYTYTLTGNVDTVLEKLVEKSVSLDSDFSKTFTVTANIDTYIRRVTTLNAVVDTYMKKLAAQKTVAIDGYFGVVVAYYKIVIDMSSITPIDIGMSDIDPITISCEDV